MSRFRTVALKVKVPVCVAYAMAPDADGVRLVLAGAEVTAGTGVITPGNESGTATYLARSRPYFQRAQIVSPNQTTTAMPFKLHVPSTVGAFTVYFVVATKVSVKLVINEVFANPGGTILDTSGEWFELYNAGAFPVNLAGFRVGDSASSGDRPTHVIAPPNGQLIIAPNGYRVLGNHTNTTLNGGARVDYSYGGSITLANSIDAVRLVSPAGYVSEATTCNASTVDCVQTNHVEIQRVRYASSSSTQEGISRELKNPALDNRLLDGANWADASESAVFGTAGRGTPGARNSTFVP